MSKKLDDLKSLTKIKDVSEIKSFTIVNEFEDDHLQCAVVLINNIKVEFDYYDEMGFIHYFKESKSAFKILKEAIKTSYKIAKDME